MTKLEAVSCDDKELLKKIINNKHGRNKKKCNNCGKQKTPACDNCDNYDNRALMTTVMPYVFERYDFYATHTERLDEIKKEVRITGHTKDLFLQAYEQSVDFQKVRIEIFKNLPIAIRAKCPFCMISAPNTLDHYFDKDEYPEFAIYTPNLIPCCSECNTKKGTKIFLENGERNVLHYYYDEIPVQQFLHMTIRLEDNIPIVDITLQLDKDINVSKIICNQFKLLNLNERYKDQLNDQLSNIISEFQDYYHQGHEINLLIEMINTRIRAYRKDNGTNYWLACLYDGLAKDSDVLKELLESA